MGMSKFGRLLDRVLPKVVEAVSCVIFVVLVCLHVQSVNSCICIGQDDCIASTVVGLLVSPQDNAEWSRRIADEVEDRTCRRIKIGKGAFRCLHCEYFWYFELCCLCCRFSHPGFKS